MDQDFLQSWAHVFIDFHDGGEVTTSVAVVCSGENGNDILFVGFHVSL